MFSINSVIPHELRNTSVTVTVVSGFNGWTFIFWLYIMWDSKRRRVRYHRLEEMRKSRKKINITFYVFHVLTVLSGIGLCVTAYFAEEEEKATIGKIELSITFAPSMIYNISGGLLFLAVACGLGAQLLKKSYLWLAYVCLLSLTCLAIFSAAGSAFSSLGSHAGVIKKLKKVIQIYGNKNKKVNIEMTNAWDALQRKYKCCGVDDYKEWQTVEFGLTSLRVPPSCCIPENWKNYSEPPKYCGQNMLPDHENASSYIYVKGCFGEIMHNLNLQLYIMGLYGLFISTFEIIAVTYSCFLIITKRI